MRRILLAAALLVAASATTAPAQQDLGVKAAKVDALAQQGKYAEAMAALEEVAAALWEKAPLGFRRALWVADKGGGFGAFNPRPDAVYNSGDALIAYAEPVGFGWRRTGETWRTDLAADVTIKSASGERLFHKDDFMKIELASRVRNREFMVHFTYTMRGIPRGEYRVETRLRDAVSGKSGSFTLPFTIR